MAAVQLPICIMYQGSGWISFSRKVCQQENLRALSGGRTRSQCEGTECSPRPQINYHLQYGTYWIDCIFNTCSIVSFEERLYSGHVISTRVKYLHICNSIYFLALNIKAIFISGLKAYIKLKLIELDSNFR